MLTLTRSRERQHNFFERPRVSLRCVQALFDSAEKLFLPDDSLARESKDTSKDKVAAAIGSCAFNGGKVLVLLHYHELGIVSSFITTVATGRCVRSIKIA